MALALGNTRVANVVLLGALSVLLEGNPLAGPLLSEEIWLKAVAARVPSKYAAVNQQAFLAGRQAAQASLP
jgi:Pyruvate/2-oxoacid:ferredoxin oxidoreductase gamma subunit